MIDVILSNKAYKVFESLRRSNSKRDQSIAKGIQNKAELLKIDPHYGQPIAKRLIPKEYRSFYGVNNLFRLELPNYWRMLYTITRSNEDIKIVCFIIEAFDHKEYNKRMKYKK